MQLEIEVARERFRSRITRLVLLSVAVDAVTVALAYAFEHGAPHAFPSV